MTYLIFILFAVMLLAGFLALSNYETRRGVRIFARERNRLDESVGHAEFILTHVDFGSFLYEEIKSIIRRVVHYIVHFSLVAVRAIERLLTNLIRRLRSQHAIDTLPSENAREFVKTLSDFKNQLKETRPEVPDIY